ncbi:MAG: FAD binding domain-containing protein [Flavisolibacter sp.]
MTEFILNDTSITVDLPPGMVLLDYIRYHKKLTGTKIGCREGDCGACVVLVGEIKNDKLVYSTATSCLMPIGNANKKHIVTIEGINLDNQLNPIQQAMVDEGATQCGFCTPGFVMSLAGYCLNELDQKSAISSIDGNICRCTGYKSIERAAARIEQLMEGRKITTAVDFVTDKNILPSYFKGIREKLQGLQNSSSEKNQWVDGVQLLGGGTDLYVQKHDEIKDAEVHFLFDQSKLKGIIQQGNQCLIGASATVTDLQHSPVMKQNFVGLEDYIKLVSSTPIRNMATIAGNFVNASPIGDLSIFFLALNAQITLTDGKKIRELQLRKFYKGYKIIDMKPGEYVESISFELPDKQTHFHFEKVSKRTNLDIASVNTAIRIKKDKRIIFDASISAGGVAPVPLYLEKSSAFLKGKIISEEIIFKLLEILQAEISPISDTRGSADYKRLLLTQLVKAHFIKLFPELEIERIVLGE